MPLARATLIGTILGFVLLPLTSAKGQEAGAGTSSPRLGTNLSLGADFFGMAPYPIQSNGGRVGYFVSDRLEIGATYLRSRSEILLADTDYREYGVHLSAFLDGNFYWGVGLAFRDVTLAYDLFTAETEPMVAAKEHHQSVAGTAHFGFQFTLFDRITVGSDLAGVSVPVHWVRQNDQFPNDANAREEDPKTFPVIKESLGANLQVLKSYIKVRL